MKNQYVHIVRWAQSLSIFGRSYTLLENDLLVPVTEDVLVPVPVTGTKWPALT